MTPPIIPPASVAAAPGVEAHPAPPVVLSYANFRAWLASHFASYRDVGHVNVPYILNTLDQLVQKEEAKLSGKPLVEHPVPRLDEAGQPVGMKAAGSVSPPVGALPTP